METLTTIAAVFFGLTLLGAIFGFIFVILNKKGGRFLDDTRYWTYMIISFVLAMVFSILSSL